MKRKNLAYDIFVYLVGGVLASTSLLFGYNYLTIAGSDIFGRIIGALYGILLADAAFWVWRSALDSDQLTKRQRQWGGLMMICGFALSLAFTLAQLTLSTGLGQYLNPQAIEQATYWILIAATAVNAFGVWRFKQNSLQSIIRDYSSTEKANMIDSALIEAERRMAGNQDELVKSIAADLTARVLSEMGFTTELKQIGVNHSENGSNPDPK